MWCWRVVVEFLGFSIFCIIDELWGIVVCLFIVFRVEFFLVVVLVLLWFCFLESIVFKLEVEFFCFCDFRYVLLLLDFVDGVGFGGLLVGRLFRVVEIGIFGGGIELCLMVFCFLWCFWFLLVLEVFFF